MTRFAIPDLQSPIPNPQSPIDRLLFVICRLSSVICHLPFAICYLIFVICVAACARPDDAWDRMRQTGVIRVGMDASFPPFEAIAADGALIGFDVDLARELGRRLGVEVVFVANLSYDGLYDALAVDHVDVVISALVINPDRMADFAYSTSYFDAGQVLVVRSARGRGEGEEDIEGMSDLAGRVVAVELGTQGDLEARKWARRLPDLTVVHHETASQALVAVEAGGADAALVDHVSALATDGMGERLAIVGQPVIQEPCAVAVHRGSRYLLRAINDALTEMEADGTMEALIAEWLERDS
jgi:ABC-type amino acid transport substrate-binding protein